MKQSFLSVKGDATNEIVIEKSRFIASVKRVKTEDEAKDFVLSVKSKYKDASHNCYAFVADENGFFIKFSDDGEPQGTAGMPMLEVLKGRNLYNTAVVVTRYFGGMKLGTGGLARAYGDSVSKVLDVAGIVENVYSAFYSCRVSFSLYPIILKYLKGQKSIIKNVEFIADGVNLEFCVPTNLEGEITQSFLNYSAGKCPVLLVKREFCEY